jgi:hypothetical protein
LVICRSRDGFKGMKSGSKGMDAENGYKKTVRTADGHRAMHIDDC